MCFQVLPKMSESTAGCLKSSVSKFHSVGPATEKAWLTNVQWQVCDEAGQIILMQATRNFKYSHTAVSEIQLRSGELAQTNAGTLRLAQ